MIPGILLSTITFPGVIVHEWAHKKFCDWFGVKVHKVVYFQFSETAGFVTHENPSSFKQNFWIAVGPLVVNTILAIFIGFLSSQFGQSSFMDIFLTWLGISIGMHAFPSDHDASSILDRSKENLHAGGSFLHWLSYPFFGLIWLANKLSFFWFDVIYAIVLLGIGGAFR